MENSLFCQHFKLSGIAIIIYNEGKIIFFEQQALFSLLLKEGEGNYQD